MRRRSLIASLAAGAGVAGAGGALLGNALVDSRKPDEARPAVDPDSDTVGFHGRRQPGIELPQQRYAYFIAFDLETGDPAGNDLPVPRIADNFRTLADRWTAVAVRLMAGEEPDPIPGRPATVPANSGVADGLGTHRLSFTFGFGPSLFDRIGRTDRRPAELRGLPAFSKDRLDPAHSGGDLLVQICCDDPQVLSHAFRTIRGRAPGLARLRWTQHGFVGDFGGGTPRNLFGQKDGTANPAAGTEKFERTIRVDAPDEPGWFQGGSYLVFRKIRMDLPAWDTATLRRQHRTIGRRRDDGSPLSGGDEFTAPDFERTGADGRPLIPTDSHIALVRDVTMLRRSYNYDYGFVGASAEGHAEHDGHGGHGGHGGVPHGESGHARFDSGLLFCAYLRDPGEFVRAQRRLDESDRLNAFIQHTGSALFAVPPGIPQGGSIALGPLGGVGG